MIGEMARVGVSVLSWFAVSKFSFSLLYFSSAHWPSDDAPSRKFPACSQEHSGLKGRQHKGAQFAEICIGTILPPATLHVEMFL